jgi:hypothetical protein
MASTAPIGISLFWRSSMSYLFSGRVRVPTCGGPLAPLADATIKLYRLAPEDSREFAVHTAEDVSARDYALFAQGRTDQDGEFRIDILEKSVYGYRGSTHPYAGEPFVVDLVSRGSYGIPGDASAESVQYTVAAINPEWGGSGESRMLRWEHDISEEQWTSVRSTLDVWTIVGRVAGVGAGFKVSAYDADLIRDDHIGSATTDAEGRFRIDYHGSAFRKTLVPGAEYEAGGPEVYFHVEDASGAAVYQEPKSRGTEPDRADSPNCLVVELSVDVSAA